MTNSPAPLRILVVEDDALSREVLTLLLEHANYKVDTVDSGDRAVQHLSASSGPLPDVILADIQMPGISGQALAHQLRNVCGPATALIAMSGSVPKAEATQDFDRFLLKPFTMDELTAAIVSNHDGEAANPSIRQPVTALDDAVYRKLAASMRSERLEQLYALNLSHTEARITRMRQAASNQEDAAYRREAHAIQGGCGMVGAVELQKLAASLEERGIDANHVASLDELAVAWNRLRRILVARKAGRQAGPAEGGRTE